jgi:hypothetical protein
LPCEAEQKKKRKKAKKKEKKSLFSDSIKILEAPKFRLEKPYKTTKSKSRQIDGIVNK